MKFLLSSDTCIGLMRQNHEACSHYRAVSPEDVAICTMTEASLRYSAIRSPHLTWLVRGLEPFLDAFQIINFDRKAAQAHAKFCLKANAYQIDNLDTVPVSIALAYNLTFVTHYCIGFDEVPGLKMVDWMPSLFLPEKIRKRREAHNREYR